MRMFNELAEEYEDIEDLFDDVQDYGTRKHYEAPSCNHICGITSKNKGYTQDTTYDGIPFEAEIWTNGKRETCMTVVLPDLQFAGEQPSFRPPFEDVELGDHRYAYPDEEESRNFGILTRRMAFDCAEKSYAVILDYLTFLEDNDLVQFLGNAKNGYVEYLVDREGNRVASVIITLKGEGCRAMTQLRFTPFSTRRRASVVKTQVVPFAG